MSEAEITPPEGGTVEDSGVLKAIGIMLLGIFLISCMDAMLKWLGENYSTIQIVFFRSCFAFIPVGIAHA